MTAPLDCDAVVRRLWDYLDCELSPALVVAIADHLAACNRCHEHFAFQEAYKIALREARDTTPRTAALGERVRTALAADGFRDPR